jgi:hypothetical protein
MADVKSLATLITDESSIVDRTPRRGAPIGVSIAIQTLLNSEMQVRFLPRPQCTRVQKLKQ